MLRVYIVSGWETKNQVIKAGECNVFTCYHFGWGVAQSRGCEKGVDYNRD